MASTEDNRKYLQDMAEGKEDPRRWWIEVVTVEAREMHPEHREYVLHAPDWPPVRNAREEPLRQLAELPYLETMPESERKALAAAIPVEDHGRREA